MMTAEDYVEQAFVGGPADGQFMMVPKGIFFVRVSSTRNEDGVTTLVRYTRREMLVWDDQRKKTFGWFEYEVDR